MMNSEKQTLPLDYASPQKREANGANGMLTVAYIITAFFGFCLIVLGFLERVYESLAIGGCILVGSALISAAITNVRRQ